MAQLMAGLGSLYDFEPWDDLSERKIAKVLMDAVADLPATGQSHMGFQVIGILYKSANLLSITYEDKRGPYTPLLMQQFLYFLPLPQGHGLLRPTLFSLL